MQTDTLEKIVLLIVSGITDSDLRAACTSSLNVSPLDLDATIAEARRRITLAAEFDRDEQVGIAVTRLNDLYGRAFKSGDLKTAMQAQASLSKLFRLYDGPPETLPAATSTGEAAELAAIAEHLLPLALADAGYPLREHARIAADVVRQARGKETR